DLLAEGLLHPLDGTFADLRGDGLGLELRRLDEARDGGAERPRLLPEEDRGAGPPVATEPFGIEVGAAVAPLLIHDGADGFRGQETLRVEALRRDAFEDGDGLDHQELLAGVLDAEEGGVAVVGRDKALESGG